jgi:sRNA-binding regulator protein Hfq
METQSPTFTLILAYETSLRTRQNTVIFIFIVIGTSQLRGDVNSYDDKYIVSIMTMIVALSQWRNTREKANKGIGHCSNEMLE